jgi:DsbC/DsbD-like thiol-disulfide interchange protein
MSSTQPHKPSGDSKTERAKGLRIHMTGNPRNRVSAGSAVLLGIVASLVLTLKAAPQNGPDPVQWSLALKQNSVKPGGKILATLTATIQPGWHMYSMTTPKGGPNPTTVMLADNPAVAGVKIFQPKPERQMDTAFKLETETFEKQLPLMLEITAKPNAAIGAVNLEAQVRYQACQNTLCLPPKKKAAKATLKVDPSATPAPVKIPAGYTEVPQQH